MFSYSAYGLRICSDLPVPEFSSAEADAKFDVRIRIGHLNRRPAATEPQSGCFHATPDAAHLFWKTHGTYLVRRGREIVAEPADNVHSVPRLPLLGVAMGLLLHQRGFFTLHASAVAVNGGAIAFVGAKGAGKSTTAAALHVRGHPLIADDVVAVMLDGTGQPFVIPGYPAFKLWSEAVSALDETPETLPRLHPLADKRVRPATHGFARAPVPLRAIYALADGSMQEAIPLPPQAAFVETVSHSYAQRFLGSTGATPIHLHQCANLVGAAPIYRLERPYELATLPELARFVEAHAARSLSPFVA